MGAVSIPERYVLLGLRLDRHVDGLVDGYHGPAALRERAEAEGPVDAATLADEAKALARDIDTWDGDPQRARWLAAQVQGLVCVAETVAGRTVPWREAVERCYGLEVTPVPEEHFEEAHARLESALPGPGDLADRLEEWRTTQTVPRELLLPAFDALVDELRSATRELVELPEGERFDAVLVEDKPWSAYNWYLGGLESRIEINTDLPIRSYVLAELAAHEGYPGHHTEHACKEAALYRGLGRLETSILLIHTPECAVSEGIATIASERALGPEAIDRVAELLAPHGIPLDAEVARVVVAVQPTLEYVATNVAYYANEAGWGEEQAVAYHRRWALVSEERARRAYRFATHPLWSIYVPTYSYGRELARAYVDGRRDGFRSLLTEQLTTHDLRDARRGV